MGLPKSYFKRFPGNLKAAWKAYRSESKGGGRSAPKKTRSRRRVAAKRKNTGEPTRSNHGGEKMAKRKRGTRRAAVKRTAHRVGRRVGAAMDTKPGKMLMAAGLAAAGGVATSFAVNHIPKVKDMSPTTKAGVQGVLGVAAVMFGKKKLIKSLGAGAIVAAVFALSKSVLKLDPLAGPSNGSMTLPPDVMRRMIRNGSMGLPASVRMGLPASVRMGSSNRALMSRGGSSGFGGLSF